MPVAVGFEWDEAKNHSNILKHGIDFADAVRIFQRRTLDRIDGRGDYGEPRVSSIGDLEGLLIINVTHTDRNGRLRLISARRANRLERDLFEAFEREILPRA